MAKLLVRATQVGYYGHQRRYPIKNGHPRSGEPFELEKEEHFSERWMEKLDPKDVANRRKMAEPPQKVSEPSKGAEGPTGNREVI